MSEPGQEPQPVGPQPEPVVGIAWIWRLRWLVSLAHGLLVLCWMALGAQVYWPVVIGVLIVGLGSNALLGRAIAASPAERPGAAATVMILDVVLLTALLLGTGGVSNPFTFLYLFQLVVAAMVLEPAWVWALVLISATGYASLFVLAPDPGHGHAHAHGGADAAMGNHFLGMWIAFAISGPFAALVVTRVRHALASATAQVEAARRLQERTERLSALGTLAAGAAHELATPLSTIAVLSGDLRHSADPEVAEDARVIREQVELCRTVLAQLAADGGQGIGQRPERIVGGALAERILEGIDASRIVLQLEPGARHRVVSVPVDLVAQAARQLIANASDASDAPIGVRIEDADPGLKIVVSDEGTGMTPEVLARATEPFFTTKELGRGTGLGLHFVRSIAEQVGGSLLLDSVPGRGTVATLVLPGWTP